MKLRRNLIALASLVLSVVLLGCSTGVDSGDLVGRWEQPRGASNVVLELRPDGTGDAWVGAGEADAVPLSWSLDGDQLTYTLSGGEVATEVLTVRVVDSGRLSVEADADSGFITSVDMTRASE